MRRNIRARRVVSLFCALLMIVTLLPMHVAKAAATPYYYTCLQRAGLDGDCVLNGPDKDSISAKLNDTINIGGWVLSTVQFGSYTALLSKDGNPPTKTVEATRGTYPFPGTFVSDVQKATGKKYTTASSHWSASIPLTNLSVGTWTITVVGRVVGDANSTYNIAKITLNLTSTNTGANNFAVCNDVPNPNAVKAYTKNGASKVTIPDSFVYGNTTSFNVSGWAIHDRGIDSYSYTIKDKSTGAIVYGKENKYISALDRSDLGPTAKSLKIATGNNTSHTWYNGSIYIAGMAAGTYVAYIYGKTLDAQTFPVAEITFTIKGGSVTAKEGSATVTKLSAPEGGITKTLTVQANGDGGNWKVTSSQSWVTVTPDVKNNKLKISVAANNTTKSRTATITLTCGGAKHVITVTQAPKTVITYDTKTLDFQYMSTDDVIYTGQCYYSDGYFATPATKYNSSLSTMSMSLAMSAFAINGTGAQYASAQNLLKACGFDSVEVNGDFKSVPNVDTMGVIVGHKVITTNEGKVTLIALATRGAGYHNEWAGNFNVGQSGNHAGFNIAKNKAKMMLDAYVDKHGINGTVKLWVTGYSRGAATVNLLAGEITTSGKIGTKKPISISKENIYAYCFEPPRGLDKTLCPEAATYTNIHNIVNPDDIVPEVALAAWGFIRYGVDEAVIPNSKDAQYSSSVNKMMSYYKEIGGSQRKASGKLEKSIVSLSEYKNHESEIWKGIENKIREWGDPNSEQLAQLKTAYHAGEAFTELGSIKFGFEVCPGYDEVCPDDEDDDMFSNAYAYKQGLLRMEQLRGNGKNDVFSKVNLFHLRKYNGTLRSITGIQNILQYGKNYTAVFSDTYTQGAVIKSVLNGMAGKLNRAQYYSKVQKGLTLLASEYFKESSFFDKMEIVGGVLLPHNWLTLLKIGVSSITNGNVDANVQSLIQKTLLYAIQTSGTGKQVDAAFSKEQLSEINSSIGVLAQIIVEMMGNQDMSDKLLSLIFSADTIGMAHYPELCFAWLQSKDPNYNK